MNRPPDRPFYFGFTGCLIGAGLAWFPALWIMHKGVLGAFLIGAAAGILGRCALGRRHGGLAYFSAGLAFALATICHWHLAPFVPDESLGYFIRHMSDLGWKTWVDLIFGSCLAYYILSHRVPDEA